MRGIREQENEDVSEITQRYSNIYLTDAKPIHDGAVDEEEPMVEQDMSNLPTPQIPNFGMPASHYRSKKRKYGDVFEEQKENEDSPVPEALSIKRLKISSKQK